MARKAIDLYHFPLSPTCRAVEMVADQLKVPLNLISIDRYNNKHLEPWFLKVCIFELQSTTTVLGLITLLQLNPDHTFPVINDNGFVLADSHAIMIYLVKKYAPGHELYPDDLETQANIDRFLNFDCGVMFPVEKRAGGPVLLKKAQKPNEDDVKMFHEKVGVLETYLNGKDYVAGTKSLADYSLYTTVTFGQIIGIDFSTSTEFVNVSNWIKRMKSGIPNDQVLNQDPIDQKVEEIRKHWEDQSQ
ncbi:Glutathione S-transferase 1, isoform D [Halotydeus destructor]|nr:Glutathione S-transferase 1, isoform D [Halotydeus destructor]